MEDRTAASSWGESTHSCHTHPRTAFGGCQVKETRKKDTLNFHMQLFLWTEIQVYFYNFILFTVTF